MVGNTLCSIGGLIFVLLLIFVYFIKSKQTGIDNKLFKVSLLMLTLVLITEILTIIFLIYLPNEVFFSDLMCRLNSISTILWAMSLCCYLITLNEAYKVKSLMKYIKENKNFKLVMIIFAFILILSLFFKFDNVVENGKAYISGPGLYYLYVVGILSVCISIIVLVKSGIDLSNVRIRPVVLGMIIIVLTMIAQLVFPQYLILTTNFVFDMYLVYFMFENPDLYLIREFELAKKKADDSNKAKTDFLSNMSHEIRTPMNAIMGFSESILNEENFDLQATKKDINHIYSAGTNLLEIINNILDISKIETGEEKVENKEYQLSNIILELKSIIEARINNQKVNFVTNIEPNIPSMYLGDKTKIFQILLNILSNSVKYTEVGKIELKITCDITGDKATLNFRISDTGYGIKKEDFDKLFEKFSRLDTATKNEIEGTGLGLVITKRLVTLLGGKIWFESEYGAGTIFFVELTQKIVDKKPIGDILTETIGKKERDYLDCTGYKVLLVDDNELNLKVAQKILTPYNFSITCINNGKECINDIKQGSKYDIIFLDHMMPEIDGIEVLHILHKLDGFDIPPVVALTANAITGMKEMYLNEGFDEYLSKPININELDKLIHKYFNNKSGGDN